MEMIFREEHGGEFLKVTHALAERLANAGREGDAEEVHAPLKFKKVSTIVYK